jgi:recombination protein U
LAKNAGKKFEEDFKNSIPSNIYYLRIKDQASGFGEQSNLRFSAKNPFDALMYCYPNLFLLELKSTKGTSFSFDGTNPMIKQHQIDELTAANKHKGIIPGFIFNMRKYKKTYFLHINDFNKLVQDLDKKSINQKDIVSAGAIEVFGEIKRVRYRYYIGEFITTVSSMKGDVL